MVALDLLELDGQSLERLPLTDQEAAQLAESIAAEITAVWQTDEVRRRQPSVIDEVYAVALANGVRYGLASSVWTQDFGRAMRMSRRLDFGCVWINTHIPLVAEMPHGGFKHSGYGKDLSMYGLEDYTRVKHVMSYFGE